MAKSNNLQNFIDSSIDSNNTMSADNGIYYDDTVTPDQWTLYDKILYGGFVYSSFCMPDNVLTIVLTIIFPPLGLISALISKHIDNKMPWLNIDTIAVIYKNFSKIVYSFILTSLFYLPGLIYVMNYINRPKNSYEDNEDNEGNEGNEGNEDNEGNDDNEDNEIETFITKI